ALSREGEWAEAAKAWGKVVELNPVNGAFWQERARVCRQAKDYREAIAAYEKALTLGSGFRWQTAFNIAWCYSQLGEKDTSLRWLRKALDLGYRNPETVRSNADLKPLQEDAQFKELVGGIDPKTLTRDEGWRYDLRYLAREIRRLHFNPYRY